MLCNNSGTLWNTEKRCHPQDIVYLWLLKFLCFLASCSETECSEHYMPVGFNNGLTLLTSTPGYYLAADTRSTAVVYDMLLVVAAQDIGRLPPPPDIASLKQYYASLYRFTGRIYDIDKQTLSTHCYHHHCTLHLVPTVIQRTQSCVIQHLHPRIQLSAFVVIITIMLLKIVPRKEAYGGDASVESDKVDSPPHHL